MAKPVLDIKHVDGTVEVTALDGHGGKPVSGTLVLGKPSDYDSHSEDTLREALPPLGKTVIDSSVEAAAKPAKRVRKKAAKVTKAP